MLYSGIYKGRCVLKREGTCKNSMVLIKRERKEYIIVDVLLYGGNLICALATDLQGRYDVISIKCSKLARSFIILCGQYVGHYFVTPPHTTTSLLSRMWEVSLVP
jgi:hypothetical protein